MSIKVQKAEVDQLADVQAITNEAFVADAFFKKPEYHQRFTLDDINQLLSSDKSLFLVAMNTDTNEVCGSLFMHWEVECENYDNQSDAHPLPIKVTGKFSAVSVPDKFSKRGIGKLLVKGAEDYLLGRVSEWEHSDGHASVCVAMEMGVINLRKDLFPWYESQGYEVVSEIRPNDAELTRIVLDGLDVCCVLMRKELHRQES